MKITITGGGFQSTPPVWAETITTSSSGRTGSISIHSTRVGGDFGGRRLKIKQGKISIHSTRVGGDACSALTSIVLPISIHSTRVGGDFHAVKGNHQAFDFNPLHPCGRRLARDLRDIDDCNFNPLHPCGRRHSNRGSMATHGQFQSTPPVWAETKPITRFAKTANNISIHSTRVGGDWRCSDSRRTGCISIHSTRVGGDQDVGRLPSGDQQISIHSTRVGGDVIQIGQFVSRLISIHSTRVGGDRLFGKIRRKHLRFQSTPPVWAETAKETIFSSLKHLYYNIFYRKKQENSM